MYKITMKLYCSYDTLLDALLLSLGECILTINTLSINSNTSCPKFWKAFLTFSSVVRNEDIDNWQSILHLENPSFSPTPFTAPSPPPTPPSPQHRPLYLLDFVGPPGFVQEISSVVPNVVVLDHHKTAIGTPIGGNVAGVVDMNRSGATIAFDYFRDKIDADNKAAVARFDGVRRLFEYIEDGDLWRWKLLNSKAFGSGFKDLNLQYDVGLNPFLFQQLLSLDLESLISEGMASLSEKQKLIDEALSQSYEIALGGGAFGNCLAVNADSISELRSELGHQLATKSRSLNLRGIGAVVYRVPELENDQMLKISLRSVETEDTTLSQEFGGDGHRNASSFMFGSAEFKQWKL